MKSKTVDTLSNIFPSSAWRKALLQKLIVAQSVSQSVSQETPYVYGSLRFITSLNCVSNVTISSTTIFNNSFPCTPSELFISGFLTKISRMLHTTHPSCPSWFDHNMCVCVCVCAEYRIWSSLWNSFVQPSITSSLLGSHIFLCTLFP
jgi:hypothetical protein